MAPDPSAPSTSTSTSSTSWTLPVDAPDVLVDDDDDEAVVVQVDASRSLGNPSHAASSSSSMQLETRSSAREGDGGVTHNSTGRALPADTTHVVQNYSNPLAHVYGCLVVGLLPSAGATHTILTVASSLHRRGIRVSSLVARQDFLDAARHARATSSFAGCCDPRMFNNNGAAAREAIMRHAANEQAEVMLVDLPGGLTTHDALDTIRMLGMPVLLVANATSAPPNVSLLAAAGVAATLQPSVRVLGVVLNKCQRRVADAAAAALHDTAALAPMLGAYPRLDVDALTPHHHHQHHQHHHLADADALADAADESVDVARLLALMAANPMQYNATPSPMLPSLAAAATVTVAIAYDAAFRFHYAENIAMLRQLGADIVVFAPLNGELPPPETNLLLLGGGIAEVHFERLARREAFLAAVRQFARRGGCILAEGATAVATLCRGVTTRGGRRLSMTDVLPFQCRAAHDMASGLVSVDIDAVAPGLFHGATSAKAVRGAVFHRLDVEPAGADYRDAVACAYRVTADGDTHATDEGYSPLFRAKASEGGERNAPSSSVTASLIHLFWPSAPELARAVVARAAASGVRFEYAGAPAVSSGGSSPRYRVEPTRDGVDGVEPPHFTHFTAAGNKSGGGPGGLIGAISRGAVRIGVGAFEHVVRTLRRRDEPPRHRGRRDSKR
ncbi:cobyrinic acid a,c-diamide synthase [Pycnococcus provasolii]